MGPVLGCAASELGVDPGAAVLLSWAWVGIPSARVRGTRCATSDTPSASRGGLSPKPVRCPLAP
eukprot:8078085-Alexandrium_andersonii.AAC.1